ncbi:hypothetical protein BS47DRAFT_1364945 [Hydnum rufescens UP504]|uniref:Uncharacterized protein n=1 Tax=Hydnum rufescens UP504 TaxID=1448309 RepID=A0A9P6DQA9_9AGAM|nr:hypothetical protein BS47DRAFT_1364945 [Hydnum rufescens UP504]
MKTHPETHLKNCTKTQVTKPQKSNDKLHQNTTMLHQTHVRLQNLNMKHLQNDTRNRLGSILGHVEKPAHPHPPPYASNDDNDNSIIIVDFKSCPWPEPRQLVLNLHQYEVAINALSHEPMHTTYFNSLYTKNGNISNIGFMETISFQWALSTKGDAAC